MSTRASCQTAIVTVQTQLTLGPAIPKMKLNFVIGHYGNLDPGTKIERDPKTGHLLGNFPPGTLSYRAG